MSLKLTKLDINYLLEETTEKEKEVKISKKGLNKNEVFEVLTEKLKQKLNTIEEVNVEYTITIDINKATLNNSESTQNVK